MRAGGFSREPGRPRRLHLKRPPGCGHRLTKPEAVDVVLGVRRSEAAGARMVPPREGNEARGDGRRGVGVPHITVEAGGIEPTRPRGGKGAPADGPVGGTDGQHAEVGFRLNETTTDSRAGQGRTGDGVHELGSPHRHACAPCGIRSNAEGRGGGTGRTDGGRLRGASGGEPAVTARPLQVRPVCSASRATRPHPERGWPEDSTHRDSDVSRTRCCSGPL